MCSSTTCFINEEVSYSSLDGTSLRYNATGCTFNPTTVRSTRWFRDRAISWIQDLKWFGQNYGTNGNFDSILWLGTNGFGVCDPSRSTCHNRGLAMDISYVQWNGYKLEICNGIHASTSQERRRRYLAVDASLRKYFKYVLDGYYYDSAHNTHIHADSTFVSPVLVRTHESDAAFVQAVCNNFNGAGLVIDGNWGPATETAWDNICADFAFDQSICDPFSSSSAYKTWLNVVIKMGLHNVGAGYYGVPAPC